jgi:hypothetical protein
MANFEAIQEAKNAINLKYGTEFSSISSIQRVRIFKENTAGTITIKFSEAIRTFLWLESKATNEGELFKACGTYPGDDYQELRRYLETQLEERTTLWSDVTVGRSATIGYGFVDGCWMPGHLGTLRNTRRCLAGVVVKEIKLKKGDINPKMYLATIVLPSVYYYPIPT